MAATVDVELVASELPGTWNISATNFPMWLDGSRRDPEFEYARRPGDSVALDDIVRYTDQRGRQRTIAGIDRWRGDAFVWRGSGALRMLKSTWRVAFLTDDLLVLHFEQSRMTPAGTDIAVRAGTVHSELRSKIAADPAGFGLTIEQFASLTWLEHIPTR